MINYIDKKDYVYTEKLNTLMFRILNMEAGMEINFNNVNQASPYPALDELARKVNEYVKPTLTIVNQSLQWNYMSDEAFYTLNNAFFVPSASFCKCKIIFKYRALNPWFVSVQCDCDQQLIKKNTELVKRKLYEILVLLCWQHVFVSTKTPSN